MPQILQYSAKKLKVQKSELFKTKILCVHSMNVFDLPATIQLGKMRHRQPTTAMLKRNENFKRSGISWY